MARREIAIAGEEAARNPCASGPLKRTTPMPPRPGGVAMATMVSRVENMNH